MEIRPYQNDPQLFLADLEKVSLDRLQGSGSSELDSLVKLILDKRIKIEAKYDSGGSKVITDDEKLLKKLIAYFLPADAVVKGGHFDSQIKNGIENLKSFLNNPTLKTDWTLRDFLAAVHFNLTPDRLDDDVTEVFTSVMLGHDKKRLELRDELAALTAELKVYSVIQSEINAKLAANETLKINDGKSFNLLDHEKYGFSDQGTFKKSAEYKLLIKISNGSPNLSIKDFLESSKKQSGAMTDLKTSYEYDKDNNKLANFSTSVNDRVNPLNNTVQEKTTRLNDVSSRYNAAIEALNRFIQKYDSIMRNILGAI
ncbi:virulence-associated V antigen [Photorhabdus temperata]|uniref:Type III secretion system translocon protein, LcrV/PcrV family n=1 Tax=Photorhabdus temperata subsp. temperata Meg1 TaxID=1393735 RepID=A0A081S1S3_PHOTE|nr:virulence-associated V antigen [Photorhabdus temperata]KER04876.1 type III secretion system translocon protein, LcrV/PcrV family [Photorhabdus temperata subsp. temperata Meg1]MCT8345950.1 virulence-associated V antigen [Photorhabdus temperata]